jgi:hypothetical protein
MAVFVSHAAPTGVRRRQGNIETRHSGFPAGRKKRGQFVKFFPTRRKTAQNSLDKIPGLWISLGGGRGRNAAPSPSRPEERTNAQTDAEKQRTNHPARGGPIIAAEGEKSRRERVLKKRC